uniref:C2H2-type domain-containing protein n=1 Tax=Aegilops tauschii subsp. strangulata TaxID=200361 RepID=A0A453M9H6_AEGTS
TSRTSRWHPATRPHKHKRKLRPQQHALHHLLPTDHQQFNTNEHPSKSKRGSSRSYIQAANPSMGAGMKRAREEEVLSLALSLSTDSSTSADSASAPARKRARRGRAVATSGEGEFVCKTCGRAFASFLALGGHRTSHLRGRHGLELGVGVARAIKERQRQEDKQRHDCHICGLGFETGARRWAATCAGTARRWHSAAPSTGGSRCRITRRGTRPPPTGRRFCSSCSSRVFRIR